MKDKMMKKVLLITLIVYLLLPIFLNGAKANEHITTVLNRVVMIITYDENHQPLSLGSGFFIGNDGEVATNYHVIEGASTAIVKLVAKNIEYDVISVLQKNILHDLAIIKVDLKITPVTLGDDSLTSIGDRIFAIGNPVGFEGTVSDGIISGFRKIDEKYRLIQITAPISPGSSGGPVVDQNGNVIGITSSTIKAAQNLNFAVPVKNLKEMLNTPKLNLNFSKENLQPLKKEYVGLSPEELNKKALALWTNGKFSDPNLALKYLNEAIDKDPTYGRAYYTRGYVYFDLKEYHQSIDSFSTALKYNRGVHETYNGRGWVYFTIGEYGNAIQDYSTAISIKPDFKLALNNRAFAYLKTYQKPKACDDFRKVCSLGDCNNLNHAKKNG